MSVYAIATEKADSNFYVVRTIRNQATYTIRGVLPGTYHVFSVPTGGFGQPPQRFVGAYSQEVRCSGAASCDNHTLIDVTVEPGQSVSGIDPDDFYNDQQPYPLVPGGLPSRTPIPSVAPNYPDAMTAAIFAAQLTGATRILGGAFDQCPVNEACIALQERHEGTRSAYFTAQAGSNADVVNCAVYVFQDAGGWHPLNTACGSYPAPGKTVSATFMGSGCINVRANPGYSSKIVDCLPVDTSVTIDGGPVFVHEATASDAGNLNRLWWHLVGHGWMVHQYLSWGSF